MKPAMNLTGQKFGHWLVLERVDKRTKSCTVYYMCQCRCGKSKPVSSKDLRYGKSKSCARCANLIRSDRSPAGVLAKMERRRALSRARYARNREAVCKWWADYCAANREYVNELARRRYHAHREAKAELSKIFKDF